jgi:hypothetical protein
MKQVNNFCSILAFIFCASLSYAQVITTVVGTDWAFPRTPLPAINAPLSVTFSIAPNTDGNIYTADVFNNMVMAIAPDGTLTVAAGNGLPGYSGDGGPATTASLTLTALRWIAMEIYSFLTLATASSARSRQTARLHP